MRRSTLRQEELYDLQVDLRGHWMSSLLARVPTIPGAPTLSPRQEVHVLVAVSYLNGDPLLIWYLRKVPYCGIGCKNLGYTS